MAGATWAPSPAPACGKKVSDTFLPGTVLKSLRRHWRVAAASALSLLLLWRVGSYLVGRTVLEKELLASVRAEWSALEQEEKAIPEGENAAEVWEEAMAALPPHLWCRVQVEDRGNIEGALARAGPGLRLVDRALSMRSCLFPIKKPVSPFGPFLVAPFGPAVQSEVTIEVPYLLMVRARRSLASGRLAEAGEDAHRVLRCAEQASGRWYEGPLTWGEAVRLATVPMEAILGRDDLPAGVARALSAFPGSEVFEKGRENQLRLHRLHADIDLLGILSGKMRSDEGGRIREELGLPSAIPLLKLSLSDVEAIRELRANPHRPLRKGMESWPAKGPPAALGRLDLLRAAAALRAFQIERGRPAATLEEAVPGFLPAVPLDPWSDEPLHYETRGGRWILRMPTGKVPEGVFADGTWRLQEMDISFSWPPRPISDSAWRWGGR